MLTTRCSSLNRLAVCAASIVPPAIRIEEPSEPAELGTGCHGYLGVRIANGFMHSDAVNAYLPMDFDPFEFDKLCDLAFFRWMGIAHNFPSPRVEYSFRPYLHLLGEWGIQHEGITLTGTADVLSIVGDEARILDHKTGWHDGSHSQQLRGYAWLALNEFPECTQARVSVLNVRNGTIDTEVWGRTELAAWWFSLAKHIVKNREIFAPSEECRFCPRRYECPAKHQMIAAAAKSLDLGDITAMTPGELLAFHARAKAVEGAAKVALQIIKEAVHDMGGVVDVGDGRELAIECGERREIQFANAEDVLKANLGDAWRECVSVGNVDLEKVAMKVAPKRGGAKLKRKIWEELDAADAIEVKVQEKLVVRKSLNLVEAK
jgi:hypothetical protein